MIQLLVGFVVGVLVGAIIMVAIQDYMEDKRNGRC